MIVSKCALFLSEKQAIFRKMDSPLSSEIRNYYGEGHAFLMAWTSAAT
jgi:hypothetical protein